ncbi:MAG: BrnT family toxin [Pseudomonadota bacterium]|nr:BrnT family toxin [Pseudomonadota bacterium]
MDISFDAAKSEHNFATRGIAFEQAAEFEWDSALLVEDLRRPYGEQRFQALGLINGRLHMLVFTPRASKAHVISLRKANKREVERYEAQA